ncbi:hypothetical protein NDU88_008959 [Pleurodeles waltl]|uniref:Secreted protein n=1 Tax=Pleurodeles waltl TaxID=8319 RepID=A0AAV7RXQ4_PLEWA|nr:hypothetical protein NDU88_008959 [Pleurodeles waltl]
MQPSQRVIYVEVLLMSPALVPSFRPFVFLPDLKESHRCVMAYCGLVSRRCVVMTVARMPQMHVVCGHDHGLDAANTLPQARWPEGYK